MKTSRLPRWGVWAIAFLLAANALYWLMAERDRGVVSLAGGGSARVLGVTYGTNHVFETGPLWARLAARSGAANWARRAGYKSYNAPSGTPLPSLMVWLECRVSPTNPVPRHASVVDLHGVETEPVYQAVLVSSPPYAEAIAGWRFENYPRHESQFRLRLYEYDPFQVRARREGELLIRNPVRATAPSASAPRPPVTAKAGALECELLDLRCGEPLPKVPLGARKAIAPWVIAEFAFRENGQPSDAWTIKRMEALSASGNYLAAPRPVVTLTAGRRVARFAGPLWPDEPDWKVTAEFVRTRVFPAESLWTFRLASACLASPSFATNLTAEADGLEQTFLLQLQIGLPFGVMSSAPRQANLALKYTPVEPDGYLNLVRATDDTGSECLAAEPTATRHGWLDAQLKLPAAAAHVDLTFALHRSRTLTFHVSPARASTNAVPASASNTNRP